MYQLLRTVVDTDLKFVNDLSWTPVVVVVAPTLGKWLFGLQVWWLYRHGKLGTARAHSGFVWPPHGLRTQRWAFSRSRVELAHLRVRSQFRDTAKRRFQSPDILHRTLAAWVCWCTYRRLVPEWRLDNSATFSFPRLGVLRHTRRQDSQF